MLRATLSHGSDEISW